MLAQIFGIAKPLMIIFKFIIQFFTQYNLDNPLVNNFLCYFTKEQNKDDDLIWKYKNFKDFKNLIKNLKKQKSLYESKSIHKNSILDLKENINEKINASNFPNNNQIEELSEIRQINNFTNRKYYFEDKTIKSNKDFINEIKIELGDKIKKENYYPRWKMDDVKSSANIANLNDNFSIKKENNAIMTDLLNLTLKIKNKFPYIGFILYYFHFLIPKKNKNYNSNLNHLKIIKYFSQEILQILD